MVEISASLPPLIGRVLENLDAYRAGTLTILELAENLFATASAVEGDVPADLRVKIANGAGALEGEGFTSGRGERAEQIVDEIDAAIRAHYPLVRSPSLVPLDFLRVERILSRYREPVLAEMRAALDRPGIEHLGLMRYHLGWEDRDGAAVASGGGKMLRPALCLLACEAVGGDVARAMPAAAAIELVHNFTLVHDDIEDASDTRHGRETLWRVRGVPQAINAGDGMFVLAQRTLLRMTDTGVDAERIVWAATVLNEACVALCEGQHADIGFETRDAVSLAEYEAMIAGKTASLIAASMAIGAIAGGADAGTVAALEECGRRLGMAFQVQDDVLGVWGDAAQTGKPVADDIRSRKKSFPVVYAREQIDAEGRAELDRLYASDSMKDQVVGQALALLERAGAREAAAASAAEWAASAIDAVRGVSLEEERRGDLAALASFFVYRTA